MRPNVKSPGGECSDALPVANREARTLTVGERSTELLCSGRNGHHVRRFPPAPRDAKLISLAYALDNYAIDLDYDRHLVDAFATLSDNCHYRYAITGDFGFGQGEFCGFTDGFYVTFSETHYHAPTAAYLYSPDTLQIYIGSSGDGEYVPSNGAPLSFEAPSMAVIMEPADA